jgi:hypothetical protein
MEAPGRVELPRSLKINDLDLYLMLAGQSHNTQTISTVLHNLTSFWGLTRPTLCLILFCDVGRFQPPILLFGGLTVQQPAKINVQHNSTNLWVDVLLAAVVVLSLGSLLYRLMN